MENFNHHILVTGGTGYIGSHIVVRLLEEGYDVTIVDNLSNSDIKVLNSIEKITGRKPIFHEIDLRDLHGLQNVFKISNFDAVIHLSGLKAVGESQENPLKYYEQNVGGTLNLLKCMEENLCKCIIFSSSACVYGDSHDLPLKESTPVNPTNTYGRTKLMTENILQDMGNIGWSVTALRYFNPIGAHKSGLIGEKPSGTPNNLMPYILQVATKKRAFLKVFGDDYETSDGTGARDYIHVIDLAEGHIAALKQNKNSGYKVYNLGTGSSHTVFEILTLMRKVSGESIPHKVVSRRSGDAANIYADTTNADKYLYWKAKLDLEQMCQDSWRWQKYSIIH